ncbi:hypothetical protein Pogu_1099 [Pyrobaculum oguniense TE7]|uniref:Uncharacterized protein n=1 Tax=Pyrobaculum oguniense (strain DSM 13380 / JCM 10595 / TE7) TaxID=698757 RepID=H6QA04_PYROT|nr:hypothetical protein Pogu_1099 [Pyrobaculum oguniense TE7]
MGHVLVKAKFRGREEVVYDEIPVDTGTTLTVLPLEVVDKLIETSFAVELKLGDGRKVYVAEAEIEGRKGPVRIVAFKGATQ